MVRGHQALSSQPSQEKRKTGKGSGLIPVTIHMTPSVCSSAYCSKIVCLGKNTQIYTAFCCKQTQQPVWGRVFRRQRLSVALRGQTVRPSHWPRGASRGRRTPRRRPLERELPKPRKVPFLICTVKGGTPPRPLRAPSSKGGSVRGGPHRTPAHQDSTRVLGPSSLRQPGGSPTSSTPTGVLPDPGGPTFFL